MRPPLLSAGPVDRASHRRTQVHLIDELLADPQTRVLVLDDGRAPLVDPLDDPGQPRLRLLDGPLGRKTALEAAIPVFLGEDGSGTSYVSLAVGADHRIDEPYWASLRDVGGALSELDAGLLTGAVAVARWHERNRHCSNCGAATNVTIAGWARACPDCGMEHYPRVDPAVIMAVVDAGGRILLGRQAVWPERRFSTLAGFVEPGETLEDAVRREVAEEVGVRVGAVEYRGSQPWPLPQSLMLGFRAVADSADITVDVLEISEARWWTREDFAADVAAGRLLLPGRISIARALVEDWFGGPVDDTDEQWR